MQANSSYIAINNMNTRVFALLFFAAVTGFISCKNKDLPPATPLQAYLNVVNASPDTIKYYINGTRQNNTSNLFVGGSTAYLAVISGKQSYKFSKATGDFTTLFTTTYDLTDSVNYSLFVAGTTPDQSFLVADPLLMAYNILAADTADKSGTQSTIRFVNASPDAGSLNVTVGAGDTVNVNNASFKYTGPYMLFKSGLKEVKVYQAGSSMAKIDTMINFQAVSRITLFTKGLINGKGSSAFSVSTFDY
jgi:hypothetical protein